MKRILQGTFKSTARGLAAVVAFWALVLPASVNAEDAAGSVANDLGIAISGFIDTAYSHNFNNPSNNANGGRIFDVNDDSFTLHQAQVLFEREAVAGKSIIDRSGFALRLGYGEDARLFAPSDTDTGDEFDIEEAYVTFALTNTLTAKMGKYATLLGAEVIESKDNLNFSRSFLFGFAIPFTHTGARFTYAPSDMIEMNLGLVNGWDTLGNDDNGTPSLEANVVLDAGNISWSHAIIYGDEPVDSGQTERVVYDTVLSLQATDQLSFIANFDYGNEQGTSLITPGEDSDWFGGAGYVHYAATDRLGFTLRGEVFKDDDGSRTGMQQTLYETTITTAYKLTSALETRFEYRHDESSATGFFADGKDYQNTIAAEVIFTF